MLDEKLLFTNHISKVCSRLAFSSHIIGKFTNILPRTQLLKLFYAYSHAIILYGLTIYGSADKNKLHSLKKIFKILLRKLWGTQQYTKVKTTFIMKQLSILNLDNLLKHSIACFMHKIINKNAPDYMIDMISNNNLSTYKTTRHSNLIRKPKLKLTSMKKSFSWLAPTIWNEIPQVIKNNKFCTFKSYYRNFLLDNQ